METLGEKSSRDRQPPVRRLIHVLSYDDLLADTTQSFALDGKLPIVVGRAAEGPLRLSAGRLEAADGWLSTSHAELTVDDGDVVVRDKGSRNGVWVNGARVPEQRLEDGDLIELGHGLWCFRLADAELVAALEKRKGGIRFGPTRTWSAEVAGLVMELERLAPSTQAVMVIAETGAGKEFFAQAVHAFSQRKGAFVAVDCGAVPESLFESTFFGHRKGARTAARCSSTRSRTWGPRRRRSCCGCSRTAR